VLTELEKNGLVKSKREGRRRVHHLTEEGREGAIRACKCFCRDYGEI